MEYEQFETRFPEFLASIKAGTRRIWKLRGKIPSHVVAKAEAGETPKGVTKAVAKPLETVVDALQAVTTATPVARQEKPASPEDDPYKDDWETGFRPITEEYVRSLGYGSAYKGDDWFERGKRAVLSSRRLGETSGRVKHERWSS